ncbi:PAS domain S-box protein [Niveibacterium terrae]|uniref:PAS domain S-box protein n=1 Tax=Niveibacterium terrae TaxID=3373598 RepID=UPI003A91505E
MEREKEPALRALRIRARELAETWLPPFLGLLCFVLGSVLALSYWHGERMAERDLAEHHFHRGAQEILGRMECDIAAAQAIGHVLSNSQLDSWSLAANVRALDGIGFGRLGLPLEGIAVIRRDGNGVLQLERWWPVSTHGVPLEDKDAGLVRLLDEARVALGAGEEALAIGHAAAAHSTLGAIATHAQGGAIVVQVFDLARWIDDRVQMPALAVVGRLREASGGALRGGEVGSSRFPAQAAIVEQTSIAAQSGIWVIEIAPLDPRFDSGPHLLALTLGLAASAVLALLVVILLSWQRRIEQQIRLRTEDLVHAHARLERVLSATRDGIWEFSAATREVRLSAAALALLGLSGERELFPARELLRRVLAEDRPALFKRLKRTLELGWILDTECRIVDAAGRLVWLRVRAVSEAWQGGDLTGALSDVTQQRRAAEQIERQQDFLVRVLDAIPCPIMVRDAGGRVLLANKAFLQGVGMSRERLIGSRIDSFPGGKERGSLDEASGHALAGNCEVTVNAWIETPGYGRRHYRTSKVPQSGPDGMAVLITSYLDTTHEIAAAEQSARQHEALRQLIELMPVGVQLKDSSRRVILVNAAFCEQIGLPAEELLGRMTSELVSPELGAEVDAEDERAEAGEVVECLRRFRNVEGRDVAMRFRKSASVDAEGEPILVCVATDLTDLFEAQAAEREALTRFDALYRSSPLGLVLVDRSGQILQANPAFCDLVGCGEAGCADTNIKVFLNEGWLKNRAAADLSLQIDGTVAPVEKRIVRADGEQVPVRASAALMTLANGETLVWILVEDISTEVAAREALQAAEQRWQFALAGDGVWDWNLVSGKVFYSPHWKAMLGHAEDEIGDSFDEWTGRLHPEDRERALAAVQEHLAGRGGSCEFEVRLRGRDGRWIWVLDRGRIVERDRDGKAVRAIGIQSDISRRRAAQEELECARDMLQAISAMQEAFIQDEASPRSFDIVLEVLMRRTASRFGFVGEVCERDGRTQLRTLALCDVSWNEAAREACSEALDGGAGVVALEGPFGERVLSGEELIVDQPGGLALGGLLPGGPALQCFLAVPVSVGGKVLGLLGVANAESAYSKDSIAVIEPLLSTFGEVLHARRNRMARRAAESELKRHRDHLAELVAEQTAQLMASRDTAEAANEAKTLFLANMSHELRTPLHAVLSFARLGSARLGKASEQRIGEFFARIEQSADRLLLLLNDLLDLSRLQAGRMPLAIEPCSLAGLVGDVLGEFEAWLAARRIETVCEFAPVPPVPADPLRLGQVIRNLVSNAIKFSPEGSTLKLSLACAGAAVEMRVSDQGVGIPEAELEAVFNPFVQSSATRTGAGGTGLGLAICREIVSAHRGSIRACNHPGGGAVFVLSLPLIRAVEEEV